MKFKNREFVCVRFKKHTSIIEIKEQYYKYRNILWTLCYIVAPHFWIFAFSYPIWTGQHWTERNTPIAELLNKKNKRIRCILCLILTLMKLWFCAIEILFWAAWKVWSRKSSISWKLQINLNSLSACRQRAENTIKSQQT